MENNPEAERISIDELPEYSDWPERIVGEIDWTVPDRDIKKIKEEYDEDKYKRLLKCQQRGNITDPEELKNRQIEEQAGDMVCVSENCKLYMVPNSVLSQPSGSLPATLGKVINGGETVIELGCGYGINLHRLNKEYPDCDYIGGEFSDNAVQIASTLYDDQANITVEKFNYYDDDWGIFNREFESGLVVFTRHSIEQLPQFESIIETFHRSIGSGLRAVIHLEPVYEMHNTKSMLQLLRKKYTQINDYNQDLLTVLKADDKVIIDSTKYDIGGSALNPTSLVRWHPA
jgi:SAM-dependent methyltransferase